MEFVGLILTLFFSVTISTNALTMFLALFYIFTHVVNIPVENTWVYSYLSESSWKKTLHTLPGICIIFLQVSTQLLCYEISLHLS